MITTARLHLRTCTPVDVDAVMDYRSRPDVTRHVSAGVWSRDKAERELEAYASSSFDKPGDELVLLVEKRDTGRVIGEVGLAWLADPPISTDGRHITEYTYGTSR